MKWKLYIILRYVESHAIINIMSLAFQYNQSCISKLSNKGNSNNLMIITSHCVIPVRELSTTVGNAFNSEKKDHKW